MAMRPNDNKNTDAKKENNPMIPPTGGTAPVLNFQDAPEMPDAKELAAKKNPFLGKVQELSKSGKAAYVEVPKDSAEWARTQIRNAANAIGKGSRTKVAPVEGNDAVLRVYFTVTEKVKRSGGKDE